MPFCNATLISPLRCRARLFMSGRLVRTLDSGEMPAGRFSMEWDGKNEAGEKVASGVYVYEMKAGEFVAQRKLVVMR